MSPKEQLLAYYNQSLIPLLPKAKNDLVEYRGSVFSSSAGRSFLLITFSFVIILLCFNGKLSSNLFFGLIGILFLVDMVPIAKQYLNNNEGINRDYEHWQLESEKLMPLIASPADRSMFNNEILENPNTGNSIKNYLVDKSNESEDGLDQREIDRITFGKLNRLTNYRVLNIPSGVFQETSTSYFHKSLGGYHSAKIQRYQDLIDSLLGKEIKLAGQFNTNSTPLLNMLNAKYIILNPDGNGLYVKSISNIYSMSPEQQNQIPGLQNENRLGNAWFVKEVKPFSTPNEEFSALKQIEPLSYAIADTNYKNNRNIAGEYSIDEFSSIVMTDYSANKISYNIEWYNKVDKAENYYAVFSEIYYPLGWKAKIDGNEVKINRVNYTLRGLKIPGGSSEIELYYELDSFKTLSYVSLASSFSILLLFFGFIYLSVFKKKDE